ncbi:MAG: MaoC/PaaZ C-terminal domain-containing protein [Proteobacteria bacterium]|nr:MaoC/PaaZ C-terminal domain-containing protein [Pseudomonadota bacterium]
MSDTWSAAANIGAATVGLCIEDIEIGDSPLALSKGPISVAHIVRWSAATENWHRIHYDRQYATEHDKLPGVIVNGSWKQHVLLQMLTDWLGESGWLYQLRFKFQGMNVPGDTLTAWGKVMEKSLCGQFGLATLEIGMRDQLDQESTPGTAVVVLSRRGGPAVPYPFDPIYLEEDWDGTIVE